MNDKIDFNKQTENYYINKDIKVRDTGLGCFFGIVFALIVWGVISALNGSFTLLLILAIIAYIGAIIISIIKERRFIGIGLILVIVVPLIIFGGCLLVIQT